MIAKNIKGKSFAGCVKYVMKKDAEILKAEGVMTIDNDSIIKSFEFQRGCRTEIKSPVGHIPISFSPEDKPRMTNDFMVQLAEEYMQNMGIKDTQYIIVRHHDSPNEHIHIVYNRIDNSKRLISDKNDFKRNIAICKRLKDKHNLTYGEGKGRVKRERLKGADKTKYEIYDAIKKVLPTSQDIAELANNVKRHDVSLHLKCRRGTEIVEGILFSKGEHKFKGSEIDRKYSYNSLLKILADKQIHGRRIPITVGGVRLSHEQRELLGRGKSTWIENMTSKTGDVMSVYARYSDDDKKLHYFRRDPDNIENSAHQASTQQSQSPEPDNSNRSEASDIASAVGGLFDFSGNPSTDSEEELFRHKMQQKKKKGRRM